MATDEPMPAESHRSIPKTEDGKGALPGTSPDVAPENNYDAEAEAMESLVEAGFQLVNTGGPENAPQSVTFARCVGHNTDFVYLMLDQDALSLAFRYPYEPAPTTFEEASGEAAPPPTASATPGSITEVIREVLEWQRD
ncbi:hypothetical protein GCM10009754_35980 [Amycolatopsis minnesotensis]|uniref:DUF302 domain-containing protein n=2 Tax=Amycolatopsis minnesotensis TaxID=337894 RepID=A0ABN2R168_9PSEU